MTENSDETNRLRAIAQGDHDALVSETATREQQAWEAQLAESQARVGAIQAEAARTGAKTKVWTAFGAILNLAALVGLAFAVLLFIQAL